MPKPMTNRVVIDMGGLNGITREIQDMVNKLPTSFNWSASPQGYDYWMAVHQNLQSLLMIGVDEDNSNAPWDA